MRYTEKKDENNKKRKYREIGIAFPRFLWLHGTDAGAPKEKQCCMNRKHNKKT